MKKLMICALAAGMLIMPMHIQAEETKDKGYITIIEGEDWGPAVTKLVIPYTAGGQGDFQVTAVKKAVASTGEEINDQGEVLVNQVYRSDETGNKSDDGNYTTIELTIHPDDTFTNPFYFDMEAFANSWADVTYTITSKNGDTWKKEINRIKEGADMFDKGDHTYTDEEFGDITLQYANYSPKQDDKKNPLIIWLHGQGEGGTDTDITLLGNEVVALAKDDIQSHFTAGKQMGVYVLAVQTPTYWMDEGDGTNGAGAGVSRYTEVLMDTIKDYVSNHSDVDTDRIYLTGGSNGGYMTLNLAINNTDYFAALVPQAAAYSYYQYQRNEDGTYTTVPSDTSLSGTAFVKTDDIYFDEDKIAALKDIPIWFIHAANDTVVNPSDYSLPIYKALVNSGATNKWFSYYESVEGSDMKDTSYLGHWSWTYFFNDKVSGVQSVSDIKEADDLSGFSPSNKTNGGISTVKVDGTAYDNIFDWLNAQKK